MRSNDAGSSPTTSMLGARRDAEASLARDPESSGPCPPRTPSSRPPRRPRRRRPPPPGSRRPASGVRRTGPSPSMATTPSRRLRRGRTSEYTSTMWRANGTGRGATLWSLLFMKPGMIPNMFLTQPVYDREDVGLHLGDVQHGVGLEHGLRDVVRSELPGDLDGARRLEAHEGDPGPLGEIEHARVPPDALDAPDRPAGAVADRGHASRLAHQAASASTIDGCVVIARSGAFAERRLGFRSTRSPARTNSEIPPRSDTASRTAAFTSAGS